MQKSPKDWFPNETQVYKTKRHKRDKDRTYKSKLTNEKRTYKIKREMNKPQTQTMTVNCIFLLDILYNTQTHTVVTTAQINVMWKKIFVSCHPFPYIFLLWNKVPWCLTRGDMPLYCVPTCECETTVTEAKINLESEMIVAVEMAWCDCEAHLKTLSIVWSYPKCIFISFILLLH